MTAPDWRDARVLVTGARGFIAGHLCRNLIRCGALVYGSSRGIVVSAVDSRIQWLQADLTEADAVRRLVSRVAPDVVFHLAGHVTGSQVLGNVEPTLALNLMSTVHLLTAATETGRCRVVLAGSMHEPDQDDSSSVFCSPYAVSKWACSGYARMFRSLYELPVTNARIMMVYGPGQWDVTKLVPYVATTLLAGASPALSSGAREFDWVFVDDVVEGLMTVARSSSIDCQAIDLGSGTLVSIRDIVQQLAALVGSDILLRFGALADRPFEPSRVARVEETERLTGWVATTPLREGLSRTVRWYREEGHSRLPISSGPRSGEQS